MRYKKAIHSCRITCERSESARRIALYKSDQQYKRCGGWGGGEGGKRCLDYKCICIDACMLKQELEYIYNDSDVYRDPAGMSPNSAI